MQHDRDDDGRVPDVRLLRIQVGGEVDLRHVGRGGELLEVVVVGDAREDRDDGGER